MLICTFKPVKVTQEHFCISHKMVTEGYRLCSLQMSIARHNSICILLCLIAQNGDKLLYLSFEVQYFFFKIKPDINSYLIVPAPCCVKPLACLTQPLSKLTLDKGVYVLGIRVDSELTAVNVGKYAFKTFDNCRRLAFVYDASFAYHFGMSDAAFNVLSVHPAVKRYRGVEVVCFFVDLFGKSSCPKLHVLHLFIVKILFIGENLFYRGNPFFE